MVPHFRFETLGTLRVHGSVCAIALALLASEAMADGKPVTFDSRDGFKLHADLYSANERGPGILMLHQCDRKPGATAGYSALAHRLSELGCHVLVLDFRGYGRSVSDAFDGENWQEARAFFRDDVSAAFDFLIDTADVTNAGVVGASCGGRHAVELMRSNRGRVHALTFLSAGLGESVDAIQGVPVFCVAARRDPYGNAPSSMRRAHRRSGHESSRLEIRDGHLHGTPILETYPNLVDDIANWLVERLTGDVVQSEG